MANSSPIDSQNQRGEKFKVSNSLTIRDVPPGTKRLRLWLSLPDDNEGQKVLNIGAIETPLDFKIFRDPVYGNLYLYSEILKPDSAVTIRTKFTVARGEVGELLDPDKAGSLTDSDKVVFAEYLRKDCPNMEVTDRITRLSEEICATESNIVKQTRLIYNYLIDNTNHYSISSAPKSSNLGSAGYCLDSGGGGCTDQHALFIALARARGIPTRLQFGVRLPAKNEGIEVEAGYRCWVQYFVPNYGWINSDVSAGDTTPAERDRFVSGLDCRRIHFSEGRDLDLAPRQTGPRINLVTGAYVETDGTPHTAFERRIKFETLPATPQ